MSRVAVLLTALLVGLASSTRVDADPPPTAAPQDAVQLSESDAIQIAEDEARRLKINLEHFYPPRAMYISNGRKGKWHILFVAKFDQFDTCFSMDIYRSGERPNFFKCG